MIRTTCAALLLMAATPALAEGPGPYAVDGVSPDGEHYTGTATLSQTGKGMWSISWIVGKNRYVGYGVGDGHVLAISYSGGGQSGVASYVATPDGSYSGVWAMKDGQPGTERLIPR